jgi:rhodanese-related sulfurtransferase
VSIGKYYLKAMRKYWKKILKLLLQSIRSRTDEWSEITVDELFDRINSNQPPLLIDVRSAEEYNGGYGHIPNARLIPMLEFSGNLEDLASFREKEIVTMCPGGGMSLVAVEVLTEAGFKDVKSLKGGTDLWHEKGYPTTTA